MWLNILPITFVLSLLHKLCWITPSYRVSYFIVYINMLVAHWAQVPAWVLSSLSQQHPRDQEWWETKYSDWFFSLHGWKSALERRLRVGTRLLVLILLSPLFMSSDVMLLVQAQYQLTNMYFLDKEVFWVNKLVWHQWGAQNSNYLLVMVSTIVMLFSMDPLSPRMTPGWITASGF